MPEQRVDAFVALDQIDEGLIRELEALEPFGLGNPAPVLATDGLQVVDGRAIGRNGQHLKLFLRPDGDGAAAPVEAVGWNMAVAMPEPGRRIAVAYEPEINTYMGRSRIQLVLKDMKPAAAESPSA